MPENERSTVDDVRAALIANGYEERFLSPQAMGHAAELISARLGSASPTTVAPAVAHLMQQPEFSHFIRQPVQGSMEWVREQARKQAVDRVLAREREMQAEAQAANDRRQQSLEFWASLAQMSPAERQAALGAAVERGRNAGASYIPASRKRS